MLTSIINKLIYRPDATGAPSDTTPARLSLSYEDVSLTTRDGVKITGWYVTAPEPKGALLYLHGNGGDRRDWVHAAPEFITEGYNVFILDYRGYGESEGRPTEEGLYLDGEAAWEWLEGRTTGQEGLPVFILGKSLGSGVATYLAAEHSPAALILDSAFTSMREVVAFHAMLLPPRLVPELFESLKRIHKVLCPTLVIHGDRDNLVPVSHGLRLYDGLKAPKALQIIQGAGHNDIDSFGQYHQSVIGVMNAPEAYIEAMKAESEALFQSH